MQERVHDGCFLAHWGRQCCFGGPGVGALHVTGAAGGGHAAQHVNQAVGTQDPCATGGCRWGALPCPKRWWRSCVDCSTMSDGIPFQLSFRDRELWVALRSTGSHGRNVPSRSSSNACWSCCWVFITMGPY